MIDLEDTTYTHLQEIGFQLNTLKAQGQYEISLKAYEELLDWIIEFVNRINQLEIIEGNEARKLIYESYLIGLKEGHKHKNEKTFMKRIIEKLFLK